MPTYDYRCPKGHEFELFQRMSAEPRAECPECGEEAERVISGGAGFLFKGEGFYITDYRSEEYKKKASAEKKKAGAGGSASSGEGGSSGSGERGSSGKAGASGSGEGSSGSGNGSSGGSGSDGSSSSSSGT